ncbi:hypothetical protein LBMAG49_00590 [Planctomycetota bacterium]|nr:hypothetical protein LBMAG49_00590 [Planctomycetota bacterium]
MQVLLWDALVSYRFTLPYSCLSPNKMQPLAQVEAVKISVHRRSNQQQMQAESDIGSGACILRVSGDEIAVPTRHSIQVGVGLHLETKGTKASDPGNEWRYLNHSCEPNAFLRGRDLVALRQIARGEQITFDYSANEFDMATPFLCACGARQCRGMIRGYRHLSDAERALLAPIANAHVCSEFAASLAKSDGVVQ